MRFIKGRVQYFYTVFRESNDGIEDRFAILVDKIEEVKANSSKFGKYHFFKKEVQQTIDISMGRSKSFADDVKLRKFDYCSVTCSIQCVSIYLILY